MRIKQKPEDFSVKESYRFDPEPEGRFFVYRMDKQKLSTFEAVERIRERFGLRPGSISFCGLKDKQGRTEQLIAVEDHEVEAQDPDLKLTPLGRTAKALSAANTVSNRFSVTVRSLEETALGPLTIAAAEVNRLGVVNYFDSQRFGSLKHGQGYIAKDLIRGDFEAALKNHMAKPSPLDRTEDAKVKAFWRSHWGHWDARPPFAGAKRYERIVRSLRKDPKDFARAFLQIDAAYRALLLFTYQSYLWNEGVRRFLQLTLPREHLFPLGYQAGTLLFHHDAGPEALRLLRETSFPLLSPHSTFANPIVREAAEWALGKEKLTLDKLVVPGATKLLYFKHEERPILAYPHKLVLGRSERDELNRGRWKLNVAFTLPPGSYATLVVKRLFHFSPDVDDGRTLPSQSASGEGRDPRGARDDRAGKGRLDGEEPRESRVREARPRSDRPRAPRAEAAPRVMRRSSGSPPRGGPSSGGRGRGRRPGAR